MKRFDLYGWRTLSLATARELIARATGVSFALHDSAYHGGDYYRSRGLEGAEILIQSNFKDEDGYSAEEALPGYETLVYVNGARDEVTRALASVEGLEMLRSEVI